MITIEAKIINEKIDFFPLEVSSVVDRVVLINNAVSDNYDLYYTVTEHKYNVGATRYQCRGVSNVVRCYFVTMYHRSITIQMPDYMSSLN